MITIAKKVGEEYQVIKYIDVDRDGKVDLYGYGMGEPTLRPENPYTIKENNFFLSRDFAEQQKYRAKTRQAPQIMDFRLEQKVTMEFHLLRENAYDPLPHRNKQ